MFLTRLLTAALLAAGFIAALLWLGALPFAALVALIVALAGYEWAKLCRLAGRRALLYALCGALGYAALAWASSPAGPAPRLAGAVFAAAAAFWCIAAPLLVPRVLAGLAAPWLLAAGFLVLLPAALAMSTLARGELLLVFVLVWIADTAAYLAGRRWGRRKLAPAVSPGKTWEGVAGALVGTLVYAVACALLVPRLAAQVAGTLWLPYLGGVALLCALSVLGDLLESALKRRAAVKDSGALLPGHGGVLDRIDSATAVLPVAALLLQILNQA